MGCCGRREKLIEGTHEQRWDYINLSDFKSTSCWSPFSLGIVYYFFIISVAVYVVDIYTAANLLFFDRWSSQVKPAIPLHISRWVFAGCIMLSWLQLAYRWWKAIRAMRSGFITASYLDPLAVRVESIRMGKGRGWRRFLVFTELTKGRKGSEYVALFTYFNFEAWTRIVFAEGPRQVINAVTLWSVLQLKLIPKGAHGPSDGHTAVVQFFVNVKILANENVQQATILFGMLYVLIIWVISALTLITSCLMYIIFLWHHIPSHDGSLAKFCRRKIEKRLNQIVKTKVDKAIAKEQIERVNKIASGAAGASVGMPANNFKHEPTLPDLDSTATFEIATISRQATLPDITPFGTRPASPFIERPSSPSPSAAMSNRNRTPIAAGHPAPFTRKFTQSSLNSTTSYNSDAPLISSAGPMGYNHDNEYEFQPSFPDRFQSRSGTPFHNPPQRSYTATSTASDRPGTSSSNFASVGLPRTNTGMSNVRAPSRSNTDSPNAQSFANPQARRPYLASAVSAPGPHPGPPPFRHSPQQTAYGPAQAHPQQYEMRAPSAPLRPGTAGSRGNQFGADRIVRAGTAPPQTIGGGGRLPRYAGPGQPQHPMHSMYAHNQEQRQGQAGPSHLF